MLELLTMPPPPEVIAKLTAIKGVRIAPTVLTTSKDPTVTSDQRRRVQCLSCKRRLSISRAPRGSGEGGRAL